MRARGFTLIELLVTLSLLGVLGALAVPSLESFISNSRLRSHASALQNSLMLARSEAIKRGPGFRVVVCKSDTENKTNICATSGGWELGWIVLVEKEGSVSGSVNDPDEGIINIAPALAGSFQLRGDSALVDQVWFKSTGGANVTVKQVLWLCPAAGGEGREIEVWPTGRVNSTKKTVTTCTPS